MKIYLNTKSQLHSAVKFLKMDVGGDQQECQSIDLAGLKTIWK